MDRIIPKILTPDLAPDLTYKKAGDLADTTRHFGRSGGFGGGGGFGGTVFGGGLFDEIVVTGQQTPAPNFSLDFPSVTPIAPTFTPFVFDFSGLVFDFSNIDICGFPKLPDGSTANATDLNDAHTDVLERLTDATLANGDGISTNVNDGQGGTATISLNDVVNALGDTSLSSTHLGMTGASGVTSINSTTDEITTQINSGSINGNGVENISVTLLHEAIHILAGTPGNTISDFADVDANGNDFDWVETAAQNLYDQLENADNGDNLGQSHSC